MKKIFCIIVTSLFLTMVFFTGPCLSKSKNDSIDGFDKGVSWKPVVPLEKTTFVNYDENSYIDDYSYLAAVPTAVFNGGDKLYSHPLIFYEDEYEPDNIKEITLNARTGIDFFMEDWMSYCNGDLDQMTLINVDKDKVSQWESDEYVSINADNPYSIASKLALNDWSFSDKSVVAVIDEEFSKPDYHLENKISGELDESKVYHEPTFNLEQTNTLNPVFHEFTVGSKYKYIKAETWWDCLILGPASMIPPGDPDMQLYCRDGDGWMQAQAVSYWNVYWPPGHEYTHTHVFNPGDWKVGITDLPTQTDDIPTKKIMGMFTLQGSLLKALSKKVNYYVDITMYPGTEIDIPDTPPFGCRNARFKLTWDNRNVNLGFSLIGPAGEVIHTTINESRKDYQEMHINQLGECLSDESYSISVFSLNDMEQPVDFEIEYSWEQNISKKESNSLTSATQGAVYASILNAPLLYTSPSKLHSSTKNALYKLGVKDIYLVNIGNHLSKDIKNELKDIANIKKEYKKVENINKAIRDYTNRNDVIFSTIDPWTSWYYKELRPNKQIDGALFIGPAACIAAHHGAPVVIVDNHPKLNSAVVWHNEFWRRFSYDRYTYHVSVANMVFTGRRIYDFLKDYDYDKEGSETIITVADQFDIGIPWDRIFPGVANSGRICGTPVDTSYWIQRNVFYPALIHQNPGVKNTVKLINGSVSKINSGLVRGTFGGIFRENLPLLTLKIGDYELVRESAEEDFENPVLISSISYEHRFNERASKYFGATYECANGDIPGETPTLESIDQGSIEKYTGETGAFFPDLSESEIVPFYLKKGGYDPAFSTSLDAVVENLNRGVIMWFHFSHGSEGNGGQTLFWSPEKGFDKHLSTFKQPVPLIGKYFSNAMNDENPWRAYEWFFGSTDEPDTMSMDTQGVLPWSGVRIPGLPATGQTWLIAYKPFRVFLNNIIPFVDPFEVDDLYDGVTATLGYSKLQTYRYGSLDIEENMENIHSAGFITSICQTSNTYFHLMLIRHGSVFQVQDPWPTSWYGCVWRQSIPRDIILGKTVGEAYSKGISYVGTLYLGGAGLHGEEPQWWWDDAENVVYFGDPDLRAYVPSDEYSTTNTWDEPESLDYEKNFKVKGHTPFGATSYPHEKKPKTFLDKYLIQILVIIILIIVLIGAIRLINKRKYKK